MSGPAKGSCGAKKISDTHKGSHEHDKKGGFAAHPESASEAGRIGGETVFARYGRRHFKEIGHRGGIITKNTRGSQFYSEIGRKGGRGRAEMLRKKKEKS